MIEEKHTSKEKGNKNSPYLYSKNFVRKTMTCAVLSLLLLSTTMILAPAPQQAAMGQPTPAPTTSPSPAPSPSASAAPGQTPQIPQRAPQLQAIPQLSPESGRPTSTPQLLDRAVANLPNIPPNTQPAGQPIPGQFIAILKTPATIPTGQAGQLAIRSLEQQADTLSSQIDNAASPDINVTDLGNIGAIVISSERASQGASPQGLTSQGASPGGAPANATGTTPELQQIVQRLETNPNVLDVVQDITVNIDQVQVLPAGENRKDADWSPRPGRSGDRIDAVNADIAILDTGVQINHPDLTVVRCVGFGYPNCADGNGHGTHVAGIAYVFANRNQIEAVNLSLGATGSFLPAESALRILAASGVTVAVSAGTNGINANGNTPARAGLGFNGVITVSAYGDSDGRCGGYGPPTSRGPDDSYAPFSAFNVDIAAAGVDVYSTYRGGGD